MKNKHKIDSTSFILGIFVLLVLGLFSYLYLIEKKVADFTQNNAKIVTLQLIDKEFDTFSLSLNHFVNYDTINDQKKLFTKTFLQLKNNLSKEDDPLLQSYLQKIETTLQQKIEDLEYFKALNSSLINSSHFLFDLQTTISEDPTISLETKNLLNETLFYILKFSSGNYISKDFVHTKLENIHTIAHNNDNFYLNNFYTQSCIMLDTLNSLKKVAKTIQNKHLSHQLQDLQNYLTHNYNNSLFMQKIIATIFFIITLLVLLILIISHLRSIKTKKELLAFKYAMQHSDNMVVITDPERHIVFVNEAFEKATGYTKEEAFGKNPNFLKSGMQNTKFYTRLNKRLAKGKSWEGQLINKRKDGSLLYEKASIVPVFLDKKLINYLAIKLDITEYIEKNNKLALAASVFENTEEAIIIADKDTQVLSINPAFRKIFGFTLKEMQKEKMSLIYSDKQDKHYYKNMWKQIQHTGLWRGKLITKTKQGDLVPVWTTIKRIDDKDGNVINYTVIQTDLREIESSQAKADYLAYHDPLTGLYNRVHFEEYLHHALAIAKRTESILAVLFIDLDRFKTINDTLGHDIGDEVLIEVSNRLKLTLRESDFISRWGGDEFVVILENLSNVKTTSTVAQNIINKLQEPIYIETHKLITTASIGIALYPQNGTDANTLIKHADSAMYLAKDMGKNRYRHYSDEFSHTIKKRLDIDIALRSALNANEFYVVYQPQYSLKTKQIIGIEALIRWENETLGFVPPDKFIPIAEESGVIIDIGYFVFESACKAFQTLRQKDLHLKYVAINVSSIQFSDAALLERFIDIANRYHLKPSDIEIEITERFMMEDITLNTQLLEKFRQKGFRISIDDFGTGYSSMSYLKRLPIDTLKIDKSFIDDVGKNDGDNTVVEAIIALAQKLGYLIVAEGIETKEQEEFLANAECDLGQGYYFSKPITTDEIIQKFLP